ncbi:MAG TPA: hypothetical protein VF713_09790 [Thermoanaerobaculia bacterium]
MKVRERVLWSSCIVFAVSSLFIAGWLSFVYADLMKRFGPALPYDPHCDSNDQLCLAWAEFRQTHAQPWQGIAVKRLDDGSVALLICEPTLPEDELDRLVGTLFGGDRRSFGHRRWFLGADGSVYDLLVAVSSSRSDSDLLADPLLRDRIALLQQVLFGTSAGAQLELITKSPQSGSAAPNVAVSPYELLAWIHDEKVGWRPVSQPVSEAKPWAQATSDHAPRALEADDGTLVALTFPISILQEARQRPEALEKLGVPFRQFAVASDVLFGGMWTPDQAALFGRRRTTPTSLAPALRFETFSMLASDDSDALTQSFGVPTGGQHINRDSEPYTGRQVASANLSHALVNTELGALLELSDEILKSWSEGGTVQYLYFNHPALKSNTRMSDLTKSPVTANWTTSGSAGVVERDDAMVLTTSHTAALPVTYRLGAKGEETKQTRDYEQRATQYFSDLRDPLLSRVAQYALLHELLRTIGAHTAVKKPRFISVNTISNAVWWTAGGGTAPSGGHVLDARILHLKPGAHVNLDKDSHGGPLLQYPAAQASGFESHAFEMARLIAHNEATSDALARFSAAPAVVRTRSEALVLPPHAVTPGAYTFGCRLLPEGSPLAEELKNLARTSGCCSFAAADGHGGFVMSDGTAAFAASDTISLSEALNYSQKPVFLSGVLEWQLRALASSDAATAAAVLGNAAAASRTTSAIAHTDLNGRRFVVPLPNDEVMQRFTRRESTKTWKSVSPTKLRTSDLDATLKAMKWDPAKDGEASSMQLRPLEVAIIAGFADGKRAPLDTATAEVVALAVKKGASRAQCLMTIRNDLKMKAGVPIRRVVLIEQHAGKTTVLMAN